MKTLKLAVVGKDVSKSASPQIHNFIAGRLGFKISYDKISIPEDKFESTIDGLLNEYDGLNVTIPYKLSVISHLKNICGDAEVFGAVNTVDTAARAGYNTDGDGFALMLTNNDADVSDRQVLLLGAGGAGRSVAKKLTDAGAKVFIYDTRFENAVAVADEFGATALKEITAAPYYAIVNATGVGMHATEGISPVGADLIKLCDLAVDLIYVPQKSEFLKIAERCNKQIINGEAMLFYQAYYSDCIYFGITPDERQAKKLFEEYKEIL